MIYGESKGTFRERLQREGRWSLFVRAREELKGCGVAPRDAWQQAAEQGGFIQPASQQENIVDYILVIGSRHSPHTERLAAICPHRGIPLHLVAGWDGFDPSELTGRQFIGIALGEDGTEETAEAFIEKLSKVVRCGWLGTR